MLCVMYVLIQTTAAAQLSNTLFFDKSNFRKHYLNPAEKYDGRLYYSVPGLFLGALEYCGKSNVDFNGLFGLRSGMAKFQNLYLNHDKPMAYTSGRATLAEFGYVRQNGAFLNIGLHFRSEAAANVSKDFYKPFTDGINKGENVLPFMSSDTKTWAELVASYSRSFGEKLTLGISLKYLYGFAAIKADLDRLSLNCDLDNNIRLSCDGEVYLATSKLDVVQADGGWYDEMSNKGSGVFSPVGRSGFGADFGAVCQIMPKLKLSASVLDLGFIKWRDDNTYKLVAEREISSPLREYGPVDNKLSTLEPIYNTLKVYRPSNYTTKLNPKIYFGGEYALLNDRIGLGAFSKTMFLADKMTEEFVMSANLRLLKQLSFGMAYTFSNFTDPDLGLGVNITLGGFNLYASFDNFFVNGIDKPFKFKTDKPAQVRVSCGIAITIKNKKENSIKLDYSNSGAIIVITGTVYIRKQGDKVPSDVLAAVTVTQAGTTNSTLTDAEGHFRIEAPEDSALIFSLAGYETYAEKIDQRNVINVSLKKR